MASASRPRPTRRAGLAALLSLAAAPVAWASPTRPSGRPKVITLLGDSITAGLGLPAAEALPAQLADALSRLGLRVQVRGAGVSGDTTADALARVDFSVRGDTDLALIELGGNDLLQGVEPATVKANLTAIIARLKARHIPVVLAGMRAPLAIGGDYARAFNAVYPAVARAEGVTLYPYLLESVGGVASLNQHDGIHPNAAGVRIIAARLAPVLARALHASR
jgi:acyl-CoA thioesterase-1